MMPSASSANRREGSLRAEIRLPAAITTRPARAYARRCSNGTGAIALPYGHPGRGRQLMPAASYVSPWPAPVLLKNVEVVTCSEAPAMRGIACPGGSALCCQSRSPSPARVAFLNQTSYGS